MAKKRSRARVSARRIVAEIEKAIGAIEKVRDREGVSPADVKLANQQIKRLEKLDDKVRVFCRSMALI